MDTKLNVGIVGCFQNGKSTFVNCLLDDLVARTGGEGVSVTSVATKYVFGETRMAKYYSNNKCVNESSVIEFIKTKVFPKTIDSIEVSLWKPILKYINIIDTPGINANEKDSHVVLSSLQCIDCAIVILTNRDLSIADGLIFSKLFESKIPFYVVMNCYDITIGTWNPICDFNKKHLSNISSYLSNHNYSPMTINQHPVFAVNLLWFWYASEMYQLDDIEKKDDIIYLIKKYCKNNNLSSQNIDYFRTNSNLLILRHYFDNDITWGIPINCIKYISSINNAISLWKETINQIINKI